MYSIRVDRANRIVHAELSGFFTVEEVAAFARDEQQAAMALWGASGEFGLLLQTGGRLPQSQEVVAAFGSLAGGLPIKANRIAIVSHGALLKMQLRRILTGERARVFDTVEEARGWIAQGLKVQAEAGPDPLPREWIKR